MNFWLNVTHPTGDSLVMFGPGGITAAVTKDDGKGTWLVRDGIDPVEVLETLPELEAKMRTARVIVG